MNARESKVETSLEFAVSPAQLAESCQRILKELGSVKNVSRETGIITGYIGGYWSAFGRGNTSIKISGKDEVSRLEIQISHTESGVFATGKRAGEDLAKFTDALGKDPHLKGTSSSGW